MMYPERLLTEDEEILREFHPHWRALLGPYAWSAVALAGLVAGFVYLDGSAAWATAGIALVGWLALSVRQLVGWRFTLYVLTTERIIVRTGVLSRTGTEIPLESIDNVIFRQRATERLLGYGDLVIESAQGVSTFADIPRPQEFQGEVYRARETRTIQLQSGHARVAAPGEAAQPAGPRDAVERLEALARLHDAGKLTDAEFEEKKARLLDEI